MCHPDSGTRGQTASGASATREQRFTVGTTGATLPVFEAAPDGRSKGNVLIIHDVYGANDFYHNLAHRFAAAGYSAYLPDLFVRQGPLREQTREAATERRATFSEPQAIEDLKRTVDAIQDRASGKIGVVGFCMGGTLVMLMAAREPRLAAAVIYYGFPANRNKTENRPYEPLEETDQVQVPLLGFWGDQDHGVGMDNVDRYKAGLDAAGKTYDFTIYPGLPHGFLTFDESSPNYQASQDSWRKTLTFFDQQLA